jgi:hypothetical protein
MGHGQDRQPLRSQSLTQDPFPSALLSRRGKPEPWDFDLQ